MGVSMSPRYYDPYYIPPPSYIYNPSPRRIIVVNRQGMVPVPASINQPTMVMTGNGRLIIIPPNQANAIRVQPAFGPHGPIIVPKKKKKVINNLREILEEKEITQSILEKGEQKNCSICLEDFVVGDKIIYLPCFHYYHSKCIDTWVKNSDKCPLCNLEIKIPQQ